MSLLSWFKERFAKRPVTPVAERPARINLRENDLRRPSRYDVEDVEVITPDEFLRRRSVRPSFSEREYLRRQGYVQSAEAQGLQRDREQLEEDQRRLRRDQAWTEAVADQVEVDRQVQLTQALLGAEIAERFDEDHRPVLASGAVDPTWTANPPQESQDTYQEVPAAPEPSQPQVVADYLTPVQDYSAPTSYESPSGGSESYSSGE